MTDTQATEILNEHPEIEKEIAYYAEAVNAVGPDAAILARARLLKAIATALKAVREQT